MTFRWRSLLIAVVPLGLLGGAMFLQPSFHAPSAAETARVHKGIKELQVVPTNVDLSMNNRSPYGWILGDGFEMSEGDGTWIVGLESSINFATRPNRLPREILIQLVPLVASALPEKRLTFVTSAAEQSLIADDKGGAITVRLKLDGKKDQSVRIFCDSLVSPLVLKIGPDRRPMCAKLLMIHIKG